MTTEPTAAPSTQHSSPGVQSLSRGMLPVALIVGCLLAGAGFWFSKQIEWVIPDDMAHINAMSPPADLARLDEVKKSNLWNNSWMRYTVAGVGVGIGALILGMTKNAMTGALGLVLGPVFGFATGMLGLLFWQWVDAGQSIPGIGEGVQALVGDSLTFGFVSILLTLPFLILLQMSGDSELKQKGTAIPLAGLLTGLLVPFIGTMVLPTYASTGIYPFETGAVSTLWFAVLAILLLLLTALTKSKAQSQAAASGTELGAT